MSTNSVPYHGSFLQVQSARRYTAMQGKQLLSVLLLSGFVTEAEEGRFMEFVYSTVYICLCSVVLSNILHRNREVVDKKC